MPTSHGVGVKEIVRRSQPRLPSSLRRSPPPPRSRSDRLPASSTHATLWLPIRGGFGRLSIRPLLLGPASTLSSGNPGTSFWRHFGEHPQHCPHPFRLPQTPRPKNPPSMSSSAYAGPLLGLTLSRKLVDEPSSMKTVIVAFCLIAQAVIVSAADFPGNGSS